MSSEVIQVVCGAAAIVLLGLYLVRRGRRKSRETEGSPSREDRGS